MSDILNGQCSLRVLPIQGESGNSGKGVHMHDGVGVGFADFISFFLNIP